LAQDDAVTRPDSNPAGGAKRGPYSKGVKRRQQILDRALVVFDELGFERTSLRAIADEIGVTHPTLVHYFGSREQLFLEVLREYDRRGVELTEAGGLTEALTRGVAYSTSTPGLMALLNSMVARALESGNEHSREFFVQRYAQVRQQMVRVLEVGRAAGKVRDDVSLEDAAMLILAAADGLSTQWLLDQRADMRTGLLLLERLLEPPGGLPAE
jgi:AcrR family transcriptional regulator